LKKILIDTNIIIDLLAKSENHYLYSAQLFSLADKSKIQLIISTLSIANAYYLLNDVMKFKGAREVIGKFKVLVSFHSLTDKIVELALNDKDFKDFEDGIQYYTALDSNCKAIITRNTKDFRKAKIPVLQPLEYLTKIGTGR